MTKSVRGPGTPPPVLVEDGSPDLAVALRALVLKALHGAGEVVAQAPAIADDLAAGLAASGPRARPGVAILSSLVAGLGEARYALGVWRHCLRGVPQEHEPLQVVFIWLAPKPAKGSALLSRVRRILEDEKAVYRLKGATTVEEALLAAGLR